MPCTSITKTPEWMTYVCQRIPAFIYQQIVDQEIYSSGFKTQKAARTRQYACMAGICKNVRKS